MSTHDLVRLEQEGNVLIVSPLFGTGAVHEADLYSQWALIERTLYNSAIEHVTIDLSNIQYFGSIVLEWMVLIWKRIRARGGQFVVCHCSELGRQILAITRFDTQWKICDNRASALATFA